MIIYADAVIEPGTVMVESLDAAITDGTVPAARCPKHEAVWAHLTWMYLGQQVEEVMLLAQVAGVSRRGDEEAKGYEGGQGGNYDGEYSE